jgi:hypothetical protein
MEGITLNTIPAWVPGIVMLYTAFVWMKTRKSQIRMDSTILAYTLIAWGALYLLSGFSHAEVTAENLEVRVAMSRVVICLICLSQSVPMTISYWRGKQREDNGK